MAAVQGPVDQAATARMDGGEGGGADVDTAVFEEPQDGRRPVELEVAAAESRIGEDAEPGLADDGGADEAGGLSRREAEEDRIDQLRRKAEEEVFCEVAHRRRRAAAEARV